MAEGGEDEGEAEGSTWSICAARGLWVGLQASVKCELRLCDVHGGVGAPWKVARMTRDRRVYMADVRRARAMGCAKSISDMNVMVV